MHLRSSRKRLSQLASYRYLEDALHFTCGWLWHLIAPYSAGLGLVVGTGIAFGRRLPIAPTALRMGINCGVAGALFFGGRAFDSPRIIIRL
jgi:hypothetical protein